MRDCCKVRPWRNGVLILATVATASMLAGAAATVKAANITTSGFNEDVVLENTPAATASGFDGRGNYWVENGKVQQSTSGGTVTAIGLPSSRIFTSATGSGVAYQLQPYNGNNVLHMGGSDPDSGTLNVSPGRYAALHVLAASGTNGSLPIGYPHTSDITLNFADGPVTLQGALLGYDWYTPASTAPSDAVAIGRLNRDFSSDVIDGFNGANFGLYETSLDLSTAGLSGRTLQSITFSNVIPGLGATSVFAVDGAAVPEPAGLLTGAAFGAALLLRTRRRLPR